MRRKLPGVPSPERPVVPQPNLDHFLRFFRTIFFAVSCAVVPFPGLRFPPNTCSQPAANFLFEPVCTV